MDLFNRIVLETVNSGNEPLKLTYIGIYDGHLGRAIAYRTQTEVFCTSSGVLDKGYEEVTDMTDAGRALTFRSAIHAIRELSDLERAEKHPYWISVKASTSFLLYPEMYDELNALLEDEDFSSPEKICFEFNKNIFDADREKVRKGLADLKTLGFKTLLGDFATDGFPITTLLDVPVDFIILTPEVTALALDRNKEDVLPSLVRFLRSMNVETIAAGVENDAQIKALNKMECFAILPQEDYSGRFDFPLRAGSKHDYLDVVRTEDGV